MHTHTLSSLFQRWIVGAAALALVSCAATEPASALPEGQDDGQIRLIRSATVTLTVDEVVLLVDPILSPRGTQPPIPFADGRPIPTIDLPVDASELVADADAVLLTHYHPDHFDAAAEQLLPRDMPIFCQPSDAARLREQGFTAVQPVADQLNWRGLTLSRFRSSHFHGATGEPPFGESSSFLVENGESSVFFTGDAVLDARLRSNLDRAAPKVIVANTGECQFLEPNPMLAPGTPMTLTRAELKEMSSSWPQSRVVAVHMDAINHCLLKKTDLEAYLENERLTGRILVPKEGERIELAELSFEAD